MLLTSQQRIPKNILKFWNGNVDGWDEYRDTNGNEYEYAAAQQLGRWVHAGFE